MNDQTALTHVNDLRYVARSLWGMAERLAADGRLSSSGCRVIVPPRAMGLLCHPGTAKRREVLASGLRLPWRINGLLPALTRGPIPSSGPLDPPISTPATPDDEVTNVMALLLSGMRECPTDMQVSMRYGVTQAEASAVRVAGLSSLFGAAALITITLPTPVAKSLRLASTNWPEPATADGKLSDLAALVAAHA